MSLRLAWGLGLFAGSLGAGWALHRLGLLSERRATRIVRFLVEAPSPLILCLSFWGMDLRRGEPWVLPLIGMTVAFSTLLPASWYAHRVRLTRPQTGSFLTCAFFSNLGYLGAFSAFAVYGEPGYALCMAYLMFFNPCFYLWGFWIAARYGHSGHLSSGLARGFSSEMRIIPFLGMAAGAWLSIANVPRPLVLEQLNHLLIPANTALYLIAIGSQLTFESPRPWRGPCLAMSAIKFIYTPLVAWGIVTILHLHGLTRFVVLLESATPVAVSPLVLPLLFGLDRKLSNALWLFSTLVSIPFLAIFVYLLAH